MRMAGGLEGEPVAELVSGGGGSGAACRRVDHACAACCSWLQLG